MSKNQSSGGGKTDQGKTSTRDGYKDTWHKRDIDKSIVNEGNVVRNTAPPPPPPEKNKG